jgi:hypothetical protein
VGRQKGRKEKSTRYEGKEERNCFSILFDAVMCWLYMRNKTIPRAITKILDIVVSWDLRFLQP